MRAHFELIMDDLMKSFAAAAADLKPIIKDGATDRLVDVMHKLRTHSLNLLHEARDA